ncbi:MAG: hypothetical protein AMS22_06100 [Thiotrichales bacterium SG8_50]|nr:MAG: hypothetical protein AMS22_06100 [Thiotrichales bacterium SG8_50]
MKPGVIPIMQTKLDLNRLLPVARNVLGYSLAKAADAATVPLDELPHALSCLAAFKDAKAPISVGWARPQWSLLTAGFFIVATELDTLDILEAVSGMEIAVTETTQRGIFATIVSGTLTQWREAVLKGCRNTPCPPGVRYALNMIYRHFESVGLRDLFYGLRIVPQDDQTFLLEVKR